MTEELELEGGCLCGDVRWKVRGVPLYAYHCHCRMCQRTSGAGFVTGITFPAQAVIWTNQTPKYYQSSKNAQRGFCGQCGSWIAWKLFEEKVSLMAGSFDQPEVIQPTWHLFTESKVPWIQLNDGLPCHERHPPGLEAQDQQL